jgi:uncharacterized protein
MDKVIIASMRKSAGKTSTIVGLAGALGKKIAYIKPFGERMLYRKKRLWDYDSALITSIFGLKEDPVDMSLGFDHSKLRYMYDEEGTKKKLLETIGNIGKDKEILFVEGGRDLSYGISVHLDTLSLAKYTGSKLFIVVSGDEDTILDDVLFLKKHVEMAGVNLGGVILNKVQNLEEFQSTHLPAIQRLGIRVAGVIPYQSELTHFSVYYLADRLFAKVITGEGGLKKIIKNIIIGAWSANVFLQNPVFKKENKLVITGGDRTDMILASLDSDTSAIILTNNILPPSNIISKASERDIPLLMVFSDTYQTAKQIEGMEPLLTKDDSEKVELLAQLVKKHVNLQDFAG